MPSYDAGTSSERLYRTATTIAPVESHRIVGNAGVSQASTWVRDKDGVSSRAVLKVLSERFFVAMEYLLVDGETVYLGGYSFKDPTDADDLWLAYCAALSRGRRMGEPE